MVRNAMWRRVDLVARDDLDGLMALERAAADRTEPPREVVMTRSTWDGGHRGVLRPARHGAAPTATPAGPSCCGSPARRASRPGSTPTAPQPARLWRVTQTLADPAGDHDWVIEAVADLDASDEAGELVLATVSFRCLTD